jgi:hypothetical protein
MRPSVGVVETRWFEVDQATPTGSQGVLEDLEEVHRPELQDPAVVVIQASRAKGCAPTSQVAIHPS